jgi:hypothetical protein
LVHPVFCTRKSIVHVSYLTFTIRRREGRGFRGKFFFPQREAVPKSGGVRGWQPPRGVDPEPATAGSGKRRIDPPAERSGAVQCDGHRARHTTIGPSCHECMLTDTAVIAGSSRWEKTSGIAPTMRWKRAVGDYVPVSGKSHGPQSTHVCILATASRRSSVTRRRLVRQC